MEQNKQKKQNKIYIILSACICLIYILLLSLALNFIPANVGPKKANNERAITTELEGATTLVDFNTWTKNQLGGVEIYAPSCARIYSDGGSTWSYLWKTFTFNANTYVNYNFHVTPQNFNLRTGIRIFNPSTGTDYVNITETLSDPKTYQGTLKIESQEQIRFDLRRNFYGTGISGSCIWSGFIAYSDFYAGYEEGYENGFDSGETAGWNNGYEYGIEEGYENGLGAGRNQVINNPNDYNLYTQQQYQNNYELGYENGEQNGYTDGYENGLDDGYEQGYEAGEDEGYDAGLDQGYLNGKDEGYDIGFDDGYDEGEKEGFSNGKIEGMKTSTSFWHLLEKATQTMHNFFSIEIIPGLTLATIIGVFIGLPLFIFFLKLISAK